jgi:hypothetical protein
MSADWTYHRRDEPITTNRCIGLISDNLHESFTNIRFRLAIPADRLALSAPYILGLSICARLAAVTPGSPLQPRFSEVVCLLERLIMFSHGGHHLDAIQRKWPQEYSL